LDSKLKAVVARGIPTKLYMTVTAANVDEIVDLYHYCRKLAVNFDFANVQAPYSLTVPKLAQLLPDPDRFSSQAIQVFEEWYNDSLHACIVKPLYAVLQFLVQGTRPLPRVLLSFDAVGQLYLCPFDISRLRIHAQLAAITSKELLRLSALACVTPRSGALGDCSECEFEHFCNLVHCKDTYTGIEPCGVSVYALTCKYWRPVFMHARRRILESMAAIV
jgi:MoaA/NifB/PqqE/SkfB family radical SAM enzyme